MMEKDRYNGKIKKIGRNNYTPSKQRGEKENKEPSQIFKFGDIAF